jgi:hypothetical protein
MRCSVFSRASLLATFAVAATLAGCQHAPADDFGPIPNTAAIAAQLANPTGTFPLGDEKAMFAQFDTQMLAATIVRHVTNAHSFVVPMAPSVVDMVAVRSTEFCADLRSQVSGSCACPDGGSIAWKTKDLGAQSVQHTSVQMKITLSACAVSPVVEDGAIFAQIDEQPLDASSSESVVGLIDYHTTLTSGGQTTKLDFDVELLTDSMQMSVPVRDGFLLIAQVATGDPETVYPINARDAQIYDCKRRVGAPGVCSDLHGQSWSF